MGEPSDKVSSVALEQKAAEAAMTVAAAADATEAAEWAAARAAAAGPPQPAAGPQQPTGMPPQYTVTGPAVHPQSMCPPAHVAPNQVVVLAGPPKSEKKLAEAYLLGFPLGFLGLHHFYLRRYGFGVLYFFTLGLFGVGWVADWFRMPCLVREANRRARMPVPDDDLKDLSDAYVLWFPFGIFGAHHYYLNRWGWGACYTCTLGLFGLGWLSDCCRLPGLVRGANEKIRQRRSLVLAKEKRACDAFALSVSPLGILGFQHFYLGRPGFGMYYFLTLGGVGIGWIVDWFRMVHLVKRVNEEIKDPIRLGRRRYLDDAYVLAFPLGFLGLHHFYLNRPGWGTLYLFTVGCFGIGWLLDLCRMPCLVKDANQKLEEERQLGEAIHGVLGGTAAAGQVVLAHRSYVISPQPQQQHMPPYQGGQTPIMSLDSTQLPGSGNTMAPLDSSFFQPPSYDVVMNSQPPSMQANNPGMAAQEAPSIPQKEMV